MHEQSEPFHERDQTESVTNPHPPQLPSRLGSFVIASLIGGGGMGFVYRAYDESMKRRVALKVLHPSIALSTTAQRFDREAWIVGQLDHPNITRVYSRGEDAGTHFLAMELAEGGSLADKITQLKKESSSHGGLAETLTTEYIREVLTAFINLCEAVEYVHSKGFYHRDIKPHNILLSAVGMQMKLTDFGIAHADDMPGMTRAGDFMGTVRYMSPEQLAAHRASVDKRTDIYSLGITLYELLTLHLPYEGNTDEQYMNEILAGRFVPARRRHARIPLDVETVLMKATEHDPHSRYQSAREFALDLKAILGNRPIAARRIGPIGRTYKFLKRHRVVFAISAIAVAIVVSSILYIERRNAASQDRLRTLQLLQSSVAVGKSPSDIDSDWNRLWPIVVGEVMRDPHDSLTLWFHRASRPHLPTQEKLSEGPLLWYRPASICPRGWTEEKPLYALVTRISKVNEIDDFTPQATAWSYYSLSSSAGGFGHEMSTDSLDTDSSRLVIVRLRIISQHYAGAWLFSEYDGSQQRLEWGSNSLALGDRTIVAKDSASGELGQPFLVDTTFTKYSVLRAKSD